MDNTARFFLMLQKAPRIAELWSPQTAELRIERFERALNVMSSGECLLAQFFAAVWFNRADRYGFDVVDAATRLDPEHRQIIIDWLTAPFYP